jgi:hypothetical protein
MSAGNQQGRVTATGESARQPGRNVTGQRPRYGIGVGIAL